MPPVRRGRPSKSAKAAKPAKSTEEKLVCNSASEYYVGGQETEAIQLDDEQSNWMDEPESKRPKIELINQTDTNLDQIIYKCEKLNADGEKYNVKICQWNVAGVRSIMKKNGLDYLKRENPDIITLLETKCEESKIPTELKLEGYKHYFLDSKKPGYCGIALLSKKEPLNVSYGLNIDQFDEEGRLITAEYETFHLVNVYVPNAGRQLIALPKRLQWNEAFKKHIQELDKSKPVVICGDMNVAHNEIDLANPKSNRKNAGFSNEERDGMTDLLEHGFVDTFRSLYPDRTGAYTFWSYFRNSRSKNVGWRLDYYIVSERIKNKVCDVVNRDQVFGSDHCPVVFYGRL